MELKEGDIVYFNPIIMPRTTLGLSVWAGIGSDEDLKKSYTTTKELNGIRVPDSDEGFFLKECGPFITFPKYYFVKDLNSEKEILETLLECVEQEIGSGYYYSSKRIQELEEGYFLYKKRSLQKQKNMI